MRIFALETDIQKIKDRFLAHGEREIFTATPHLFRFLTAIIREFIITVVIVIAAGITYSIGFLELGTVVLGAIVLWFLLVSYGLLQAYIDWKFDFIFLTTDKLIIVDQRSLFRKSTTPINLENLGDVVAETQWLNLFDFGMIHFALKEGQGPEIVLKYMPHADKLVAMISQQITLYQRRKDYIVPYRDVR
ncbi:MAG TPA: hypothetical protein PKV72_05380 [Candidatus Peribacteria bacterium]|nr:hypothetical protein [Candidatus Peribacteria bacterium]